jgi:hypothetical protein
MGEPGGPGTAGQERFAERTKYNQNLEGTLNKLVFVTTLLCAASLVAAPAVAKTHHKKHAPAQVATTADPGPHQPGGPIRSGGMCWKDFDPWANRGLGYWGACPK